MSRVQLALRVADLEDSIAFYSKLFGVEPAKRREGYANFAIAEPPLKLVLLEGAADEDTRLDHLGVEVASASAVAAATARLNDSGLATYDENDTSCCYALQDKVWVHGPGKEPWEVYVVKADADTLGHSTSGSPQNCACGATQTAREPSTTGGDRCGWPPRTHLSSRATSKPFARERGCPPPPSAAAGRVAGRTGSRGAHPPRDRVRGIAVAWGRCENAGAV